MEDKSFSGSFEGGATTDKSAVFPVVGKRNMIMYVLNRNEIKLLSVLNQGIQFCVGISTFLIGIIFTLFLTRISIPNAEYKATILASIFSGTIISCFIFAGLFIIIALIISFKTKSDVIEIIEEETKHGN